MLDWHQINDTFDNGIISDFYGTLPDRDFLKVLSQLLSKQDMGLVNGIMTCYFGENFDENEFGLWPEDESTHPFTGVRYGRRIPGYPYEFTQVSYDELICDLLVCCHMFVETYPEKRKEVEAILNAHQLQL